MATCNCEQGVLSYCGVHGPAVRGQCPRLHEDCKFVGADDEKEIPLDSDHKRSLRPILLSELTFLSPVKVLYPSKDHMRHPTINTSPGVECLQITTPRCSYGCNVPKMPDGGTLTKVLTRTISLPEGRRSVQLLTDSGMMLLNCTSKGFKLEGCGSLLPWCCPVQPVIPLYSSNGKNKSMSYNTRRDKWRASKFSHDPRKIFLFFATLSSLGTILLIYLCLHVNKIGEGFSRL